MIHEKMFSDIRDTRLFAKAQSYSMEYVKNIFERNVFPTEKALQDLSKFEEKLPEQGSNAEEILDVLNRYGSPATIAQIGGRYYGFVMGGVVPSALAVKYLSDFWDQNPALYVTSPIISKLETVVEQWLIDLFNLPKKSVAGFVSGTSMATFCGLAAGRWRIYNRLDYDVNARGLIDAPRIRLVVGRHAHSTVLKALALLGFGHNSIEWVDVNEQGEMIPEKIPELDDRTIIILQAGNVNSGSFDEFDSICEKARNANAWVHIDGAFGLWVAATQKLKHLTRGMEKANSWSVDGHKTLNTPYDSGIVLCNDKEALVSALQATGSYITYGENRDGMLYTPEMSRRARIVELWGTMKYLGKKGIDQMIYGLHQRAVQFAKELSKIDGLTVLNNVVFNQIIVRCNSDEITQKTIAKIQDLRECWVGGSKWFGNEVIRISISSWTTTEEDVRRSVKSFDLALRAILKNKDEN
jgi:glutamate/tyrosine decarboxylase-like PLP-dependent enzyme